MIRFQILRGLLAKKPTLKDGELFLNKTDHSVHVGDTTATGGEFVLAKGGDLTTLKTDVDANTQDIADIQSDYLQTAGGNVLTASTAVVANADGKAVSADTTAEEIGFVHGVTSAVQDQLDAKIADPTTKTDGQALIYNATSGKWEANDIPGGGNFNTVVETTLPTTGWTKSGSLYYNQITVTGETDTDCPMVFPQYTTSIDSEKAAWNSLEGYVQSGTDYVRFYASAATTTAVPIKIYFTK